MLSATGSGVGVAVSASVGGVVEDGVAGSADGEMIVGEHPESAETNAAAIRNLVVEVALNRFICISFALSSAALLV
jgi:hypothetical protein